MQMCPYAGNYDFADKVVMNFLCKTIIKTADGISVIHDWNHTIGDAANAVLGRPTRSRSEMLIWGLTLNECSRQNMKARLNGGNYDLIVSVSDRENDFSVSVAHYCGSLGVVTISESGLSDYQRQFQSVRLPDEVGAEFCQRFSSLKAEILGECRLMAGACDGTCAPVLLGFAESLILTCCKYAIEY